MDDFPRQLSRNNRLLLGVIGIAGVMVLWWLVTALPLRKHTTTVREVTAGESILDATISEREVTEYLPIVSRQALTSPAQTFAAGWQLLTNPREGQVSLGSHILASTLRVIGGFMIASMLAVPLGILMALVPWLRALANPVVSFIRPLPSISWLPLALIWFGTSEFQKLAILFMGCFAAALISSMEAALRVDPVLIRAARNLGAKRGQILFRVLLPAALPSIFGGLKVVLAIAWTCIISAEIVGTSQGLGALIWQSKEGNVTGLVLTGMVCISAVVLLMDSLFGRLERALMPWRAGK